MHRPSSPAHLLVLAFAAALASAPAAPIDWNGPPDGDWNVEGNWAPAGVPTSDDDVFIAGGSVIVDDAPGAEAGSLTLGGETTSGSLTVQGAGTGTIAGSFSVQGAGSSVVVRDGGSLTTEDDSSSSFVDYGGSITVTGSGSTWSNPRLLHVYTGTLLFDDHATVTTGVTGLSALWEDNVSTATVRNGAQWTVEELAIGGTGTATLNVESGAQVTVNAVVSVGAGSSLNIGTGGAAGILTAALVENSGTVNFNHTDAVTYAGNISDLVTAGVVTKQGSGTLTLTGTNSWTGATSIEEGTLEVGYDYALPVASAITVNAGATLSIAENVWVETGSLAGSGAVEIGENAIFGAGGNGPGTTFSGTITGGGSFEKTGSGTLTLTGANSLGGLLEFCGCSGASTLEIKGGGASFAVAGPTLVGPGTLAILDGGRLETDNIQSFSGTVRVAGSGSTIETNGVYVNAAGDPSLFEIGAGATLDTTEVFVAGSGSVLLVNGSITGGSSTEITGGGMISGGGAVESLLISAGGILSPGNSPGTLNAGNTTWDDDGFYRWELNHGSDAPAAKGVTYDWFNVTGTLAITSTSADPFTIVVASLDADNDPGLAADFDPAHSYTWILVTASAGITGFSEDKFAIDTSGFANSPNSDRFSIQKNGNNLSLVYSAVPEPAAYGAVFGFGLLALAMIRHRKRRSRA